MTIALDKILPVLRSSDIARGDRTTFHVEIPGDRASATPIAAFTVGQDLLTKAEVAASGHSGKELLEKALANLAARSPKWTVEAKIGGFLGLGKKPALITLTDPFAAEQIMNDAFMRDAKRLLSPDSFQSSLIAFVVPKRGQLRAMLTDIHGQAAAAIYDKECDLAKSTWAQAGQDAVCPAELGPSFTVGNTFAVRKRFDGKEAQYLPLADSVGAMIVTKTELGYLEGGAAVKKRDFIGRLSYCLGVRDANGQNTPLSEAALTQLGFSFDTTLDQMLTSIPILPVTNMGQMRSGAPVCGFRGTFAIDQLCRQDSLARLHETLGDPFVVHVYTAGRVAATKPEALKTGVNIVELVELCDPRQPNTIMTRGTFDYECYSVSGGKITGTVKVD